MFEKEAEEYVKHWIVGEDDNALMQEAYKDGAEFGYNKANEWHKVADGDLPKKSISVIAYFKGEDVSLLECLYIPDEGFKHPIFSEWYEPTAWIEKEKILPKELEKC